MAKVCEMIVNRDYIRENNAGHPPRASHRRARAPRYVSTARAGVCMRHARVLGYVCCAGVRACVCVYAGAMLFHTRTCVEKKAAWRAGGRVGAGGRT